jgi:hypothetical protein
MSREDRRGPHYVLQIVERFPIGSGDDIYLIGPFETAQDAEDYGATHCAPGGPDDPRWTSVNAPVIRHVVPLPTWDKGAYNR